jgi:uncharacterized protein (UPF0548 family)
MRNLFLQKPAVPLLRRFLSEQATSEFSYREVGGTIGEPPAGFTVDRTRIELGTGEEVFVAAREALQRWQQFHLGWVDAWSPDTSLEVGQVVAIMGRAVGLWWLNACRIVYVIEEDGPLTKFGFAYGTLPCHVARGEERFLLEWDRDTDIVCYSILAFSQPHYLLTRLGYPLVRRNQKRFGQDSAAAMFRAVSHAPLIPPVLQTTG